MKPNHEPVHSVFDAEIEARRLRAKVIRNAFRQLGARLRQRRAGVPVDGHAA